MRTLLDEVERAFGEVGREALLKCFQDTFHAGESTAIGATVEFAEALLRLSDALSASVSTASASAHSVPPETLRAVPNGVAVGRVPEQSWVTFRATDLASERQCSADPESQSEVAK
jgi:hypothetical protein